MKLFVKAILLLFLSLSFSLSETAIAQTKFIKYKNIMVPISACGKPRVAITLDLTNNGGDPNEWQDLSHFLIYSNYFDVRAIVASKGPGNTQGSVADINAVLTKYGVDYLKLSTYANANSLNPYLTEAALKGVVRGNNASGVDLIRVEAQASSASCPLHVLVWGASNIIASALDGLSESEKDNYSIIAIGSSNKFADPSAWANLLAFGGDRVVYSDADNTFRGFYSPQPSRGGFGSNASPYCNLANINLYSGMPVETYMNNLSASSGLRRAILDSRDEASYLNCAQSGTTTNPTYNYSARFADFTTTLYLLDKFQIIPSLNGNVKSIIENRLGPQALQAYRDEVFGDFLSKVNSIY